MSYIYNTYSPTYSPLTYDVNDVYYTPVWSDTSDIIEVVDTYYSPVYSPTKKMVSDTYYGTTYSPTNLVSDTYYGIKTPNVLSVTSPTILSPDQPITTSWNFNYSKPLYGVYQDLNTDPYTINQIVNYFHKLALDKWLFGELIDIINYFKIDSKGNVDLINSMKDYEAKAYKKYSVRDMEKIVDFIESYFLSKRIVKKVLSKYVAESGTQWVKLPKNRYFIRQLVSNKIMKLIKKSFAEKGRK